MHYLEGRTLKQQLVAVAGRGDPMDRAGRGSASTLHEAETPTLDEIATDVDVVTTEAVL